MFLLPAVVLPFIFALALYRLYTVPRRLLSGKLEVRPSRWRGRAIAATLAYVMLLGASVALAWAVSKAIFASTDVGSAYLLLAGCGVAFPLMYMAAAWVFFHALRPVVGRRSD